MVNNYSQYICDNNEFLSLVKEMHFDFKFYIEKKLCYGIKDSLIIVIVKN